MISLKIPGKLYIIGEYSILRPGNEAILVAVDKFVNIKINPSNSYEFSSEMGRFKWMLSDSLPVLMYDNLTHAKAAIYLAHMYLNYLNITPDIYHLELTSELTNNNNKKYGLGSSGAVIVGIIKSILLFHNVKISNIDLFKLSVLAQIEISDLTSGGELAASIYGGWVHYQRYDLIWVMNRKGKFDELLRYDWPLLKIETLKTPNIKLAVCYSGISQVSSDFVNKVAEINDKTWYSTFLNKTHLIVEQFKEALIRNDYYTIKHMVELYKEAIDDLAKEVDIEIVSKPFKLMLKIAEDLGFIGKISGSGHGDCGFAIVENEDDIKTIHKEWKKNGLEPLNLRVWNYDE